MLKKDYHRLLKRQLKKADLDELTINDMSKFLQNVDIAYKNFDEDVNHIENILELSSNELFVANKKLKNERDFTKTKLENIVDNIEGVIFETDLKGNFTFLNNAWQYYTGLSIKESLGKHYLYFLNNKNIENKTILEVLNEKNEKTIEIVFKFVTQNKPLWFKVKNKLIKDTSGNPKGFIGTITEITTLKETEIELQKANQSKDDFLSTMSHEIRTPLNAVTGIANILLMDKYLPEQLENLKALKYSGEHLLGLINDLLDFNKIKSGKVVLIEKEFNLDYFLENLKPHFTLSAEKKGIAYNIVRENKLPNLIIGDMLKLSQIINNLLNNALKFTRFGHITLSVKSLNTVKNNTIISFKVSDTGIGISKDKQGLIFESFMQASPETSVIYGGTGLGLSICSKLLEIQNSKLNVSSKIGEGSIFSFNIIYKLPNKIKQKKQIVINKQPNYKPLNINVLIGEDNKMNILILKQFLKKWNVTFKVAHNGEEVLKHLDSTNFSVDVILMDLQMPVLDGYEATKIIRNLPDPIKANVPIIALTAFAQTDIKEKTKQYKMNGFMGKPFNPEELYLLLQSYC